VRIRILNPRLRHSSIQEVLVHDDVGSRVQGSGFRIFRIRVLMNPRSAHSLHEVLGHGEVVHQGSIGQSIDGGSFVVPGVHIAIVAAGADDLGARRNRHSTCMSSTGG
jgi:hypothetical protein